MACGAAKPEGSVSSLDEGCKVYVRLAGLVDFAAELSRTTKQLEAARKELAGVEKVLNNPGFMAKATEEVIADKRGRQATLTASIALMEEQVRDFS